MGTMIKLTSHNKTNHIDIYVCLNLNPAVFEYKS